MPRVSESHRAARREQILAAGRRCFTRNGFHATSMQDVIAEAGLSIGAVYRYFGSKQELVTAIAEDVIGGADGVLAGLAREHPDTGLAEVLEHALEFVDAESGPDGALRVAVQVWAEAMRDESLAAFVKDVYSRFRGHFVGFARRAVASGELPPDADPEAVASVLFGLLPGYALQRILTGGPDRATFLAGVRSLIGLQLR
ncbi:TetR/AcrR family transcriptional regulator [Rhizomonospora bruguierae]|uniref:TetR/AcrR family transcriptional regulator n=1 Tax=Rhizomonospora bruguierae TaxID=1581705 RepID=UPI001BCF0EDB|nr:TetR/AcrR family transcriptional regulator [Micromonospora sp. NBRC 107566]